MPSIIHLRKRFRPSKRTRRVVGSVLIFLGVFHLWLHVTNPYAGVNFVQQPYTTSVQNGKITVHKQFDMNVYNDGLAQALGYYKSGFLIVQNSYFGSRPAKSGNVDGILDDIHRLRFDPSKPYLISGDQFSVLYPRNLGVFYNSILDPRTAHSQTDWQNRQRIYLQSALYALDAFSKEKQLATTIVPIGSKAAVLTQVHPGSVPSDSLYGLLYALEALQDPGNSNESYKLQTVDATKAILTERRGDLAALVQVYLDQVLDPATGLVKRDVHLAAARDGVVRESSFYDNVVLWKTLALADQLDIRRANPGALNELRGKILQTFWDIEGHFKDDLTTRPQFANYSSDWLIALPTDFLSPDRAEDRPYLERTIAFIGQQGIAQPFPIKYQAHPKVQEAPWAVKTFVPNYGGDAIWSYWGAEYLTLLANMNHYSDGAYTKELNHGIKTYEQKIIENRGFPETFDAEGSFLQNSVYKSIRQTGWVVQFETAKASAADK